MTSQENIHRDDLDEPLDGIKEDREKSPPKYFYLLFYGLIIWAVIFMGYYLFSGWSSHGEFQEKMTAHQEKISQHMESEGK